MEIYSLDYLHKHHFRNCISYRNIVEKEFPNEKNYEDAKDKVQEL